eukprot:Opistho-2@19946
MQQPQRCPLLVSALALMAGLGAAPFAQAQTTDWPNKPIRWVVPFPPGGAMDAIARILGEKAGKTLGQTFVIENRAGAGGNIGADAVAKSPADAHVLCVDT